MRQIETKRAGLTVYHAEVFDLLRSLPDGSVNLIFSDGPYYKVKTDEAWDTCFRDVPAFLEWTGRLLDEYRRVLAPNGSLYHCGSPDLAARVECAVGERFNVLNSIRWVKDAGWHQKQSEESLRSYLSPWEVLVFAEQFGADHSANGLSGYGLQCYELHKQVYGVLGARVAQIREKAGLARHEVDTACSPSRKPTGLCYRWEAGDCLPTLAQYVDLCRLCGDQREYESLRLEYESLRRPFFADEHGIATDQWDFPTVTPHPGKHPCQKPAEMMEHIALTSSRPGDVILDPFMGSAVMGEAALRLGRSYIGGDGDEHWAKRGAALLDRQFGKLPPVRRKRPERPVGLLFSGGLAE